MSRQDPHSFADSSQPRTLSFDLEARIDFGSRILWGTVTLHLNGPGEGPLDLDTRDLSIEGVWDGENHPLTFHLGEADPILGSRLRIHLPPQTSRVVVRYHTSPRASALQWLEPSGTAGGVHPYLFTQCQALHARSVVPLQDTPRFRQRFQASLTVPSPLRAVMAAACSGEEEKGETTTFRFVMPDPIPPYLLAFAVGDLASREIGPRSRVWAEPQRVDQAAWEFDQVESMLQAGEALFGPYDWERFDLLVMPPSFPYGGMENPRLTFLTPTLIAGDRSLVNVVAHELAHSWTGNLITNADAEHFWLNEGWTVYAERRIQEVLEGEDSRDLHAALGFLSLKRALERFEHSPNLTCLRTHLEGVDPDEVFSAVPYEKGYLFLLALEKEAGRPRFDAFTREYIRRCRFSALTTEEFLDFARPRIGDVLDKVGVDAWIYHPGLPDNAPLPHSTRVEAVKALTGRVPPQEIASRWSPAEWQLYLESAPWPSPELCASLDADFSLTSSGNFEILVAWLTLGIRSGHAPALERALTLLGEVGRMKYLRPLYAALAERPETLPLAQRCLGRYQDRYHPIGRRLVEGLWASSGVG